MTPNQILFATDFSDRDQEAFKSSCKLAIDWNARLRIVHVEDPREAVKAASQRTAPDQEFLRFIPEDLAVDFTQNVLIGYAAEEILRFAEKEGVSLIVLGTHGREGVKRFFSGSVAEDIMRNAKCPVMTKRESNAASPNRKFERILVPLDFSVYGYAAVELASQMALATSAELTICYVDDANSTTTGEFQEGSHDWNLRQEGIWKQLRGFKPSSSKIAFTHRLLHGDPGQEICDYANSRPYDVIVIGTHGRTGLNRAIMGSVAEHVVRHADCPVISVKPSNKRAHVLR